MIKAIIFDLDNCILDVRSLGEQILDPVMAPLLASSVSEETKQGVGEALWHTRFESVVAQFNVPADIADLMRIECRQLTVPANKEIKSFGDESSIKDLPVKKFLVTSGFKSFQTSKIQKLDIVDMFDGIFIDDIDEGILRKTKREFFEEILETNDLKKEEVLVVGDNPRSELGAAKELGIKAIQTLRPNVLRWEEADAHITSLHELKDLI